MTLSALLVFVLGLLSVCFANTNSTTHSHSVPHNHPSLNLQYMTGYVWCFKSWSRIISKLSNRRIKHNAKVFFSPLMEIAAKSNKFTLPELKDNLLGMAKLMAEFPLVDEKSILSDSAKFDALFNSHKLNGSLIRAKVLRDVLKHRNDLIAQQRRRKSRRNQTELAIAFQKDFAATMLKLVEAAPDPAIKGFFPADAKKMKNLRDLYVDTLIALKKAVNSRADAGAVMAGHLEKMAIVFGDKKREEKKEANKPTKAEEEKKKLEKEKKEKEEKLKKEKKEREEKEKKEKKEKEEKLEKERKEKEEKEKKEKEEKEKKEKEIKERKNDKDEMKPVVVKKDDEKKDNKDDKKDLDKKDEKKDNKDVKKNEEKKDKKDEKKDNKDVKKNEEKKDKKDNKDVKKNEEKNDKKDEKKDEKKDNKDVKKNEEKKDKKVEKKDEKKDENKKDEKKDEEKKERDEKKDAKDEIINDQKARNSTEPAKKIGGWQKLKVRMANSAEKLKNKLKRSKESIKETFTRQDKQVVQDQGKEPSDPFDSDYFYMHLSKEQKEQLRRLENSAPSLKSSVVILLSALFILL